MTRKLESWTDSFNSYMANKGSPILFTKWAGIFTIAAALERKVWVRTGKGVLYPNLYVITVGPPGAGKTLATSVAYEFLGSLKNHHLAPTSVTKASLIDALAAAEKKIIRPMDTPAITTFNSLIVASDELGVFLPSYESDFMQVLTNIYDCRVYSETRRTAKINIKMEAPQLNFTAATTPSYLTGLLPEGAWDQGFLSRTMLIYSGADAPSDLFATNAYNEKLRDDLEHDLHEIGEMYGKLSFEEDVKVALNAWHIAGGQPAPSHPKLSHYNTRRTAHLIKLCMVSSVARSNSYVITLENYVEALDWLMECERVMPDIFRAMRSGGDGKVMEECYHFLYEAWVKSKAPIQEHRLYAFLQERTPAHNVEKIINVMEKAGLIERKFGDVGQGYIPRAKAA
jgi:hypothetical protein